MKNVKCFIGLYAFTLAVMVHSLDLPKDELDKVIEDEITEKLTTDLLQSIERKFQLDLEKSVDMVLIKIKMLLQNGTTHIQEKMADLQTMLEVIKNEGESEVDKCLLDRQNETSALAEKALHQMVVCGYALIGHDPAQSITRVMELKTMITNGIKPLYGEKKEVYDLLKVCGHDHESLKKVIKCVISKSTKIKSAMMDITNRLIEGVVDLTKLMAHGAMHEACLIEVVKTTEDEAFELVKRVSLCAHGNKSIGELEKFMADNNATILDIHGRTKTDNKFDDDLEKTDKIQSKTDNALGKTDKMQDRTDTQDKVDEQDKTDDMNDEPNDLNDKNGNKTEIKNDEKDLKTLVRRMLAKNKGNNLDNRFKKKLKMLQEELKSDVDNNFIAGGKSKQ